jgi:hypothetical protein
MGGPALNNIRHQWEAPDNATFESEEDSKACPYKNSMSGIESNVIA